MRRGRARDHLHFGVVVVPHRLHARPACWSGSAKGEGDAAEVLARRAVGKPTPAAAAPALACAHGWAKMMLA